MPYPLFVTGLARGGTNLLVRMLVAHPRVMMAIHAFLPLFKSLRDAILRGQPQSRVSPGSPFLDGYFSPDDVDHLDAVHAASLDLRFDPDEWPEFLERLRSRAKDECADLCPALPSLKGSARYRELLDRALDLVADLRGARDRQWVGMVDTWTIDFLPLLARAYPRARFMVVLRDPRGVVSSMLGVLETEGPSQRPHILSVLRQWRKIATLAQVFAQDALLRGRLLVLRYEDVAREPERVAAEACRFLDLEPSPDMTDFSRYIDPATGRAWTGNSSFDPVLTSISTVPVERWRRSLAPDAERTVEFVCGAEMPLFGYELLHAPEALADDPAILRFLMEDDGRPSSWRCASRAPDREYGLEAARRALIPLDPERIGAAKVREYFLHASHHARLRRLLAGLEGADAAR